MAVDMQLLKELRNSTFAPLKDCKEALTEANWDLEVAKDILKKKGILKAGKKADRATNEWAIKVANVWWKVVSIKLLCETDFVAKNETFAELMDVLIQKVSEDVSSDVNSKEDLSSDVLEGLEWIVKEFVWKIWENVQLDEVFVSMKDGFVYNHPGNKVAAVVFYNWEAEYAKEIALQVAAMNPVFLSFDEISSDVKEKLAEEYTQELKKEWKPDDMIAQIVKWKINKTLAEDVLLEQAYIRDWSKKVKEILPEEFEVESYVRFSIG